MKFFINRDTWRNANHGPGSTSLLNDRGMQCCLGQCCLQLGIPRAELDGITSPAHLTRSHAIPADRQQELAVQAEIFVKPVNWASTFNYADNEFACEAMATNDDTGKPVAEREKQLAALFQRNGHEIEFAGDYVTEWLRDEVTGNLTAK